MSFTRTHDASVSGYPFQCTRYLRVPWYILELSIFSISYTFPSTGPRRVPVFLMLVAGLRRLLWNTGCILPNKGRSFNATVTGFITLVSVNGPIYLGPNFLLGTHNRIYFVDKYTFSPILNGGVSLLLLLACFLYAMDALSNTVFICGQSLCIFSVHSAGMFEPCICKSSSGMAGNSFPNTTLNGVYPVLLCTVLLYADSANSNRSYPSFC